MSIVAYTGLPGSGKSYGVVENVILPAMENGRHIVTNLPLKVGTLTDEYPDAKITQFSQVEEEFFNLESYPGAIWVVDEAHHYWPSGLKMNQVSAEIKAFFTEHRHSVGSDGKTTEIVIVTQDLAQVAAFVRGLVEDTYRASKLSALGMSKKYRVDIFQGAATGNKPSGHYRQLYGTYKQEVFRFYRSHTKNKTDFAAGMEQKSDDRANALKNPIVKVGLPIAILLIAYSSYKFFNHLNRFESPEKQQPHEQPVNEQPMESTEAPHVRRVSMQSNFQNLDLDRHKPKLSEEWRITGLISGAFIIDSQQRGSRVISASRCRRFVQTGEDYCIISGELVTWYSSTVPERDYERPEYFASDSDISLELP